jgi:hypothetical protein
MLNNYCEFIKIDFRKIIRRDFWSGMQNLSERMSRLDPVILLTNDVVRRVTSHFEKIRLAQQRGTPPTTAAHAAQHQQVSIVTNLKLLALFKKLERFHNSTFA